MKKDRRWLKSMIAASREPQAAPPWARPAVRKPEAEKAAPARVRAAG